MGICVVPSSFPQTLIENPLPPPPPFPSRLGNGIHQVLVEIFWLKRAYRKLLLKLFLGKYRMRIRTTGYLLRGDLEIPRYDKKEGGKKGKHVWGNSFSVRGLVESKFLFLLRSVRGESLFLGPSLYC